MVETAQPCIRCGKPTTTFTPTGHPGCWTCMAEIAELPLDPVQVPADEGQYRFDPVDLDELISTDPPAEDWHIEPMLPRGKHVGISSRSGEGKSLLLLDLACKKASGEEILEQPAGEPEHVLYIDMEMGPDELYDRLNDLGYSRQHPLWPILTEHLHYYQMIALPPLNTEEGGQELEALLDRHSATFLVIDTLARVIVGDENASQPYQELFRFTETMLKRREITVARLDHLGKDPAKGTRGASAKTDGLDVVWQMAQLAEGVMQFKRTKGRQPWVPEHITIHRRVENGTVTHTTAVEVVTQATIELADQLDLIGVPIDAGTPTAQRMLKEAGKGRRRIQVRQAVKHRKARQEMPGPPRDHPAGPPAQTSGTTTEKTQQALEENGGTTLRTTADQSEGVGPSLKEGPPLDLDETFEPDHENLDLLAADLDRASALVAREFGAVEELPDPWREPLP